MSSSETIVIDLDDDSSNDEDVAEQQEELMSSSSSWLDDTARSELSSVDDALSSIDDSSEEMIRMRALSDESDSSLSSTLSESSFMSASSDTEALASDSSEEQENIGEQRRKGRLITRNKFWSWVAPGLLSLGALTVAIISLVQHKEGVKSPLDDALTDEQKQTILDAVERWRNQPDATFWGTMADYVRDWAPSLQAQKMFMNYTKQLTSPVDWPAGSNSAVAAQVQELVTATSGATKMEQLYRKVATITYAPDPAKPQDQVAVPKYLAAALCDLSLAQIIKQLRLKT